MALNVTINHPLSEHVVDVSGPQKYLTVEVAVSGGVVIAVMAKAYGQSGAIPSTPPVDAMSLTNSGGVWRGAVPNGDGGTLYADLPWFRVAAWALEWSGGGSTTSYSAPPTEPYGHSVGSSTHP